VLTRHPLAVWSSFVDAFFDADHEAAHANTPLLERYVPAIARFLREDRVPICRVRYEPLVAEPAAHLERICAFIGVPFEAAMVDYGKQPGLRESVPPRLGDPVAVTKAARPTTNRIGRWTEVLAGDAAKIAHAQRILDGLLDEDLDEWGHGRGELQAELDGLAERRKRRRGLRLGRHALERKLLVRLRRNIHRNAFGRLVRRIRFLCDVLLR